MKGMSLVLSSVLGMAAMAPMPADAGSAIAIIHVAATKDGIRVVGQALALADAKISGELSVSRKGASGSVTSRQGGELAITAGQTADLAQIGVSYSKGDLLEVRLVLTEGGSIVSVTTLKTGG